jgi:hypothetical protein
MRPGFPVSQGRRAISLSNVQFPRAVVERELDARLTFSEPRTNLLRFFDLLNLLAQKFSASDG